MRYLLMPLLRRARSVVPPEYLPHTPLLVRATPSLRLLPRPDATTLIQTARKIVTRSGFLVRRGHVTIMAGNDEAADLWLAANFLTGRIYKNGSSPVATADLGGGTLQVTVPLNGPPEYIKRAILEKRMKSDNHQEKGDTKARQDSPIRKENGNGLTGEKGAPLRDQNKATSNYGSEIKSSKHIKKENGERRVSVSVNRRLKNNLNNNSSHDRTSDISEVGVIDEDSKSDVFYGVLQESETPRNVYASKNMLNNSMQINGTVKSVTTPDPSESTVDSILYVTAANLEFRTPPPKKNKKQPGGDKKMGTSSASPTAPSPPHPIAVHNMTMLLSPSSTKNRTSRKRKGYGRRGKSRILLKIDQTTQSITEANKTSQDAFAFDVLPGNDTKNVTHIIPRGRGIKSNFSPENEGSGKEKINLPSAREPRRRRQRGRERIHAEGKKGKVGKRRRQRGEVDKRDDQNHKREKLSFSHQASSTLMPIDRSTSEKVGRKRASVIDDMTDNFSSFPKNLQLNRTIQRRNQRKQKLKKSTRRKQGRRGRQSRKNRIKSEQKSELSKEKQPIRQTWTFPQDQSETGGVSISNLHEGDTGSHSNPSISFETSPDSTKDKQAREPRRSDLPVGGSIPIDENDPSTRRDRQSNFDVNIPEPPLSATREKNLGGNYTIRRKDDPRHDKTPNTRINSPSSDTLLQQFSERRNELIGDEHEPSSTDSVAKHNLLRTNPGDSRKKQKSLRNTLINDEERTLERFEYDRDSALKEESRMYPISMSMERIPKKITTTILEDQEITYFAHKADDESLRNTSYGKTKINNHRPLSFDNDILDTRYNREFLTTEENLVQADNDTLGPIYAPARQTPTHATEDKNQSRSITLKDRRRPPQSPLQIGKDAATTTESTTGRAKNDNNSPGEIFVNVHSPQGVRSSRQRHRHRHRHLHRKKDRKTDTLLRRKRNILEGKYSIFRRGYNRYDESKEHYNFLHNLYHISVANHKRKDKVILNHKNNIPMDKRSLKRFMRFRGKNMLIHWVNSRYNQMCKPLNVKQCNNLLYNKLMDHHYYGETEKKLTKNMSAGIGTNNEIKTLMFKMVSHKKQRDLNNVNRNGEIYDNTQHGWSIDNKNNNSFLSNKKKYSNRVVNPSVPLGPQSYAGYFEEIDPGFRRKRELRNLFDAPNITYRCSPSQKYWLFASSLAMGIYPARVKVLQSGNIVRISPTPKDSITTSSPPTATTPRHRSDIPLEEEYPELTAGYDAVDLFEPEGHVTEAGMPVPSPPPEMPDRPSLPPESPSTPPMVITSKWMEETLSKVKNVVDSILKAIGSREAYVEAVNDDGTATRIDVDIQHKRPTQSQPPSRRQKPGALPRRRRPGRKGISRRRKPIGGGGEGVAGSHQRGTIDNDTMTIIRKIPDQSSDEKNGGRSVLKGVQTYDVTLNRTFNLSHNVPLDVSNSELTNQSVPSVGFSSNITMTSNSTSGVLSEDLNLIESDVVVNHSSSGNKIEMNSNSSAPSKKTLSSVTDLLFTVPNERVINPAEDSQVKSEIKSTEELIRTSLEDLLFRVPGNKKHPDSEMDGSYIQNSSFTEGHPQEDLSSDALKTESVTEHSTNTSPSEERKEPVLVTSRVSTINQKEPVSIQDPHSDYIENEPPIPTSQAIENESLLGDSSIQKLDLILRTACLPVGSIGRFKVQDVTYLVTGLGSGSDGEDCWREVSNVVKTHIKLPSLNHTTLLATTAFYFVAANANLIEPDMAYGFVRVEQFRIAANIMCSRKAEELPDPLACLDYQYIAALLSHGLQLPGHTEILVCEKIHGFRLGWALGAALNYLQKH